MGANAGTAVPVYESGQVLDAARLNLTNSGVPVFAGTATRDAAFGGAGEKTLAEGQLAYLEDADVVQYYDGAAWATVGPSALITDTDSVATLQSTSSASFTDLATVGPAVTVTTGTKVLVFVAAQISAPNSRFGYIDFAISGATTRAAADATSAFVSGDNTASNSRVGVANLMTVTAGSNTFTMKYKLNAGTGSFGDRTIIVVAL